MEVSKPEGKVLLNKVISLYWSGVIADEDEENQAAYPDVPDEKHVGMLSIA